MGPALPLPAQSVSQRGLDPVELAQCVTTSATERRLIDHDARHGLAQELGAFLVDLVVKPPWRPFSRQQVAGRQRGPLRRARRCRR